MKLLLVALFTLLIGLTPAFASLDTWTLGDVSVTTGDVIGTTNLKGVSMTSTTTGVAVGDGGVIVYTADGGITWTVGDTGNTAGTTNLTGISMSSATHGVAIGDGGVILYTSNGGLTWTLGDSGIVAPCGTYLRGISMSSATHGVAVGHTLVDGVDPCDDLERFALYTTDGGATWSGGNSGTLNTLLGISMSDDDNGVAVGAHGLVLYTTNGGINWTSVTSGTVNTLNGVSMSDSTNGVAVGISGTIIYTSNGGSTWSTGTSGVGTTLNGVSMSDSTNGIAVGISGVILYTSNGGASWTLGNVTSDAAGATILKGISMYSATTGVAVGDNGRIVYTIDGGDTWSLGDDTVTTGDVVGTSTLNGISMSDGTNGVAVGNAGLAIYTSDGGITWTLGDTSLGTGNLVNLNGISMTSATTGVAVGDSGVIVLTSDGGANWTVGDTSGVNALVNIYEVSMSSTTTGVAVGKLQTASVNLDQIIYTTDGGATWSSVYRHTDDGQPKFMHGISMGSTSNGIAVGAFENASFDTSFIVYTTNGGTSWNGGAAPSVTNSTLISVSMGDADNGVAVGNGGVIIYTTNGGTNWSTGSSGTGNPLNGVSMSDASNGVAVGSGGLIIYTSDGGATWTVGDTTNDAATTTTMSGVSMSDALNGVSVGNSGVIVYTSDTVDVSTSSTSTSSTDTSTSGGDSGNKHNTKPTFGINHQTFAQTVDGGFSFNGVSHDIIDNWWTPFAEQEVKIGTINSFTAKVYADKQLHIQEFLFGIPAVGEAQNAELGVEIVYDYSGAVEKINVIQKTDIIDIDSISVVHYKSKCTSSDSIERCDTTQLSMKFLEPLKDKVMAIKAIDFKNRYIFTYLNEGFYVTGDSLNPMVSQSIAGPEKYEGLLLVTQTAKYSNIWIAEDGREFITTDSESFILLDKTHTRQSDTGDAKSRLHSEFANNKDNEAVKAATLLLVTCPECFESWVDFDESFAYQYSNEIFESKYDNPELQQKLILESNKAQETIDYLLYPASIYR